MHKEVKTVAELEAATAAGKVLVDFWATWCGPCLMMGQRIADELMPAMPELSVVKVNVDEAPDVAAQFGITSIPALFCFKDGKPCGQFAGVTDCREIAEAFGA